MSYKEVLRFEKVGELEDGVGMREEETDDL
jgi:hypothetical protein